MTRSPQFLRLCDLLRARSASTADFNSKALAVTQSLCEWFHCEWGTFWRMDPSAQVLKAIATWRDPLLPTDQLLMGTEGKGFRMDEGNPGLVWRTGRPMCVDNLVLGMCLPRSLEAANAGLRGGIWIPVPGARKFFGVVEILGTNYWTSNAAFLNELEEIGLAIGEALTGMEGARL